MLTYYLTSLSVIPYFTSRAFLPLFSTAAISRLGPQVGWIADVPGVQLLASIPSWANDTVALVVLGLLAVVEVVLGKVPEARELLSLTDSQIKGAGAFLLCFVIVRGNPSDLINHLTSEGLSTNFSSGNGLAYIWSFAIGAIVWFGALLRGQIYGTLMELDPDDDIGLQGVLSWLEDAIGFWGIFLAVLLPTLALGLSALTLFGLWLTRHLLRRREALAKVPCSDCGTACAPCGPRCSGCQRPREDVFAVGVLGRVTATPAPTPVQHRLELLARKRCAFCGDRLDERRLDQRCAACRFEVFESRDALEGYLTHLRASLPKTLAILVLMSAVPLVGLVAGIIYYRLSLIASLRGYLPRSTGMMARWMLRIVNLFLLMLQPIPILGILALPLMCLVNFSLYQVLLRRHATHVLEGQVALA